MANAITPDWNYNGNYTAFGVKNPQGLFAWYGYDTHWGAVPGVSLSQVKYPSDLIMAVDALKGWWCDYRGSCAVMNNETDPWWSCSGSFAGSCTWAATTGEQVTWMLTDPATWGDGMAMRKHTGGTNVLFSDGHVKMFRIGNFLNSSGQPDPKYWLVNAP